MTLAFNVFASEAERYLRGAGIAYSREKDGSLHVPGDLSICFSNLDRLPDFSNVVVDGNFSCRGNRLTSLKGSPKYVGRDFICDDNQLVTLEGAPKSVGDNFQVCNNKTLKSLKGGPAQVGLNYLCYNNGLETLEGAPADIPACFNASENQLTSLKGAPLKIGDVFNCSENQLTSLAHAPASVGSHFDCRDNKLTNLNGAPEAIGLTFNCDKNPVTSLEGAPAGFTALIAPQGEFRTWDAIPANLQGKGNAREQAQQRRKAEVTELLRNATALAAPLKGAARFRLKTPGA